MRNGIGIVALNRPDVHNAFNETLIAELTAACGSSAPTPTCASSS